MSREFHEALLDLLRQGRGAATAVIVKATGSTPREVGSRMIVPAEGEPIFSLGGGAFEGAVIADARGAMRDGLPLLRTYSLADKGKGGEGQECGGSVTVFIDPVLPGEHLWIFGAGHVGRAIAAASRGLGLEVTVFEDREELCDLGKLPGANRVIRTDPDHRTDIPRPDARTYCVVVTRSHRTDRSALRAALSGDARWVGMIGSARKKLAVYRELIEEDGLSQTLLDTVECPVGLPIDAESPEEIAISILARVVQVRRSPAG